MCGIIVANTTLGNIDLDHRGPDHNAKLSRQGWDFYHYRLSIQDLDARSNQPFQKGDADSPILVYNGEIYNSEFIRKKYLQDVHLNTSSDTEILYELLSRYGVSKVHEIDGMFTFCCLMKNTLFIGRDRLGIKPLYIYDKDGVVIISSEISVIKSNLDLIVNEELIPEFIKYKYVGPCSTIYKNVRRLEPGVIELYENGKRKNICRYFSLQQAKKLKDEWTSADLEILNSTLKHSINSQLISDVPIGTQLSGGIDSTLIRHEVPSNVPSFSSIFGEEYVYDEFNYVKEVLKKTNSQTVTIKFSKAYFQEHILKLFKNTGGVNHPHTLAIVQIANDAFQKGIKVLLSGEGADELFFGYIRYRNVKSVNDVVENAKFYTNNQLEQVFDFSSLKEPDPDKSRLAFLVDYKDYEIKEQLRLLEIRFHLQNLLERYDWASMQNSIEGRVPFLSNDMLALALSYSTDSMNIDNRLKYPLKALLRDRYNEDFIYRSKVGYRVPFNEWMRDVWFKELILDGIKKPLVKRFVRKEILNDIIHNRIKDDELLGRLYWTIINLAHL